MKVSGNAFLPLHYVTATYGAKETSKQNVLAQRVTDKDGTCRHLLLPNFFFFFFFCPCYIQDFHVRASSLHLMVA